MSRLWPCRRAFAARGEASLVKFLLDENFPLRLYRRLKSSGYDVEHIIVLGRRGLTDPAITERLAARILFFLRAIRSSWYAKDNVPTDALESRGRCLDGR